MGVINKMIQKDVETFISNLKGRLYSIRDSINYINITNSMLVQLPNTVVALVTYSDNAIEIADINIDHSTAINKPLSLRNLLTSIYLSLIVTERLQYININIKKLNDRDLEQIIRLNSSKSISYSADGTLMTIDLSKLDESKYYREYTWTNFDEIKKKINKPLVINELTIPQLPIIYLYRYHKILNIDAFINNVNDSYYSFDEVVLFLKNTITDNDKLRQYYSILLSHYYLDFINFNNFIINEFKELTDDEFFSFRNHKDTYSEFLVRVGVFNLNENNIGRFVSTYQLTNYFVIKYKDLLNSTRILDMLLEKSPYLKDTINSMFIKYRIICWFRNIFKKK